MRRSLGPFFFFSPLPLSNSNQTCSWLLMKVVLRGQNQDALRGALWEPATPPNVQGKNQPAQRIPPMLSCAFRARSGLMRPRVGAGPCLCMAWTIFGFLSSSCLFFFRRVPLPVGWDVSCRRHHRRARSVRSRRRVGNCTKFSRAEQDGTTSRGTRSR